jgi:hypothetical protein
MFILGTLVFLATLPAIFRGDQSAAAVLNRAGKWFFMIIGFFVPLWIGVVIAAADHSHPYLILNQGNCFASFVSGYVGYGDLPYVSWIVKVSTMIGLNS